MLLQPSFVWCGLLCVAAGCAGPAFSDDGHQALACGRPIDDKRMSSRAWSQIASAMRRAREVGEVVHLYAHEPGRTVQIGLLERVMRTAQELGLPMLRYDELANRAEPYALALSFDDAWPDAWHALLPTFAQYSAHVTFFVSRFHSFTPEQVAKMQAIYAAGHGVEAHTVNHANADEYAAMYAPAAYVADEVIPSLTILENAGFAPSFFAYPFGARTDATDEAILTVAVGLRGTSGRYCRE